MNALSLLRVGFDLDGVLARTDVSGLQYLKKQGLIPEASSIDQVTRYQYEDCFPGLSGEAVMAMFEGGEPFRLAAPEWEAIGILNQLTLRGVETHILTSRPERAQGMTADWLGAHMVNYGRLAFSEKRAKVDYCEAHRLDVFVEDHYETAYSLAGVVRASFLIDRKYNRIGLLRREPRRIYAWSALRQFFFGG